MGEEDGTIDKIYLADPLSLQDPTKTVEPFRMQYKEKHLSHLYAMFPLEHKALDEYMRVSNASMTFVKALLFSRLLPQWVQTMYWRWCVPASVMDTARLTAKELLPTLTSDKRSAGMYV